MSREVTSGGTKWFEMVCNGTLFGESSSGPFFGTLSRTLFAQAAKGFSFLSHGRKKRNKESPPAARISVKMEHVRLKHKNSELRSSNSLCFFTPSVLHFLNLKSMRPESSESLQHRFARCWVSSKQHQCPMGMPNGDRSPPPDIGPAS